jgi:hypothetical protein
MMAWLILITIGANMAYKVREYGRADVADYPHWNYGNLSNL